MDPVVGVHLKSYTVPSAQSFVTGCRNVACSASALQLQPRCSSLCSREAMQQRHHRQAPAGAGCLTLGRCAFKPLGDGLGCLGCSLSAHALASWEADAFDLQTTACLCCWKTAHNWCCGSPGNPVYSTGLADLCRGLGQPGHTGCPPCSLLHMCTTFTALKTGLRLPGHAGAHLSSWAPRRAWRACSMTRACRAQAACAWGDWAP